MQSISSMASLTTTFENLFHCLFFSYNIVSCCYNQALLPAVGLYCFIWHPRLIMPVFSTQHVYICLISIPPVTTLSHSLEQWFCHGAYFTIVRNGANFEKMIEPGAELVGTCPYDLLSLLPTLSYIPRKNSVLPTFWQSKEGLEDTDAKETFFFYPQSSLYNVRKGFDETTGVLTDLIFQAFHYIICPFLNSTISLSCSWFDAQNWMLCSSCGLTGAE